MTASKQGVLDWSLIFLGTALSVLFVSTDGNGQNPLPVAAIMMGGALITGFVSVLLARFLRSTLSAIVASIVMTDLLFVLLFMVPVAYSPTADEKGFGALEFPLWIIVIVVSTAPMVLFTSIGFVRLAIRFDGRKKRMKLANDAA
jgi:hypothetical protein